MIVIYILVILSWVLAGLSAFRSWNRGILQGQSLMVIGLSTFCIVAQLEWLLASREYNSIYIASAWELWIALVGLVIARIFNNCIRCHTIKVLTKKR